MRLLWTLSVEGPWVSFVRFDYTNPVEQADTLLELLAHLGDPVIVDEPSAN